MLDSVAFLDNCSDPDFEAASPKHQLGKEPQFIVAITFLVISSWGVLGDSTGAVRANILPGLFYCRHHGMIHNRRSGKASLLLI
jgi:hypothetical protein